MKRTSIILILMISLVLVNAISGSASEALANRTVIQTSVQPYDELPILEQLFYLDAERSQENPVWSPDGKTIAFVGRAGMGVWIVPAEGGTAQLVYQNYHEFEAEGVKRASYGSLTTLAFSADGKEIYYHDWSQYADGFVKLGNNSSTTVNPKIMAVNIETGETRTLIEKAGIGCFSNDRTICVYRKMGDTYTSWQGLYARNIVTGDEWKVAPYGNFGCFTADDTEVIYSIMTDGVSNLYKIPLHGGESVQLTAFTEDDVCQSPFSPQCTPDGTSVIFIAQYSDWLDTSGWYANEDGSLRTVKYYGMCSMNLETGVVSRLSLDTAFLMRDHPQISPDSTKILFGGYTYKMDGVGLTADMYVQDFVQWSFDAPISVEAEEPTVFTLGDNYPNPFNPATTIDFSLTKPGNVRLAVYSIDGQLVRELVNGAMSPGNHSMVWDGLDRSGNSVSSGMYLYKLTSGSVSTAKKMILVR